MTTTDTGSSAPAPPEEAWLRSEPALLSPASPKPLHFPQPTSIPVLDKMMDVGFNQAEPHMNNAAMHDTELRPGAWRDPDEQNVPIPSPYSTGGNGDDVNRGESSAQQHGNDAANRAETATNGADAQSATTNGLSYHANSHHHHDNKPYVTSAQDVPSDPSNTAAESAPNANALQSNEMNADPSHSTPLPGAVNVQALLDQLSTSIAPPPALSSPPNNDLATVSCQSPPQSQADPAASLPAYVHSQHIRDYHPHAAHPAVQAHSRANSTANAADSQNHNSAPSIGAASNQATSGQNDQYQIQQSPVPATNTGATPYPQPQPQPRPQFTPTREQPREHSPLAGTENIPWTPETQRKYDYFMNEERRYVNEARWDQFPPGSRLFVGNLSSEKVTKRDIFHVFHHYGEIAQISIKQAYGFVQFLRVDDCMRALSSEQGRQIRDKRIHLEISKPQKPPRDKQQSQNQSRRSRSPAYDNRRNDRASNGRGRIMTTYRSLEDNLETCPKCKSSPSKGWSETFCHGLRKPSLPAAYESMFSQYPLDSTKMRLSGGRLSKACLLSRMGGNKDVQFEEYDNLDPPICAELVIRERNSLAQPPNTPSYGAPPAQYNTPGQPPAYAYQQPPQAAQYGAPPPASYPPNYGQPPTPYNAGPPHAPPQGYPLGYPPKADANNLQNLLSSLSTASPQVPGAHPYAQPGYPPQQQQYQGQYPPGPPQPSAAPQQPQPPSGMPPAPPNMADILARLGTYNRS
ncbi:hypothetical protein BST61_g2619 [Cercospora zeina]